MKLRNVAPAVLIINVAERLLLISAVGCFPLVAGTLAYDARESEPEAPPVKDAPKKTPPKIAFHEPPYDLPPRKTEKRTASLREQLRTRAATRKLLQEEFTPLADASAPVVTLDDEQAPPPPAEEREPPPSKIVTAAYTPPAPAEDLHVGLHTNEPAPPPLREQNIPRYRLGQPIQFTTEVKGDAKSYKWLVSWITKDQDTGEIVIVPNVEGLTVYDDGRKAVFSSSELGIYRMVLAVAAADAVDVVEHEVEIFDDRIAPPAQPQPQQPMPQPQPGLQPPISLEAALTQLLQTVPSRTLLADAKVVGSAYRMVATSVMSGLLPPGTDIYNEVDAAVANKLGQSAFNWRNFLIGVRTLQPRPPSSLEAHGAFLTAIADALARAK